MWELLHRIPGNGAAGSLTSNFGAIIDGTIRVPAFLVEFEVGGVGIHKDDVCLISEALFELHEFLAQIEFGLDTLPDLCFYIGYNSDGRLAVHEILPEYDLVKKVIYFRYFEKIAYFDLLGGMLSSMYSAF